MENGRLLAQLSSYGEVLSKRYTDSRVIVHCRIPERAMGHLRRPIPTSGRTAAATGRSWDGNGYALRRRRSNCRPVRPTASHDVDRGFPCACHRRALRRRASVRACAILAAMARRRIAGLRGILTGASSGIGRALAEQLVRDGARLVVVSRRADRLDELAASLAGRQRPDRNAGRRRHRSDVRGGGNRASLSKVRRARSAGQQRRQRRHGPLRRRLARAAAADHGSQLLRRRPS